MNKELFLTSMRAFFEGRATPLQKTLIEEALGTTEYRELYFVMVEEWESQNSQLIVDSGKAFEKWKELDHSASGEFVPLTMKRSVSKKFSLVVAATVTLLLLNGFLFREHWQNKTLTTGYGELKTYQLGDGSAVTLNGNSELRLSRFGFGKENRNVYLKGEAEFVVSHLDDAVPFVVRTPDSLEVKVLGTRFVVYTREKGSKVVLNKGKVELRTTGKTEVAPMIMKPGDMISVSDEGQLTWVHDQPEEIHNAWKHHRFAFDNTPLSEIAIQLNDVFGVHVIIPDPVLAQRTIGGTYQAESAEKVLRILADILDVRVISDNSAQSPKTFTLSY